MQKSRVKFNPSLLADETFRVGGIDCRVVGGGLWYTGNPRTYPCSVHVALDEGEDKYMKIAVVPKGYDPDKSGLIYTDPGFLRDVRAFLKGLGMPASNKVDYSEQGMQGTNYVDMEISSLQAVKWVRDQTLINPASTLSVWVGEDHG